jgi:hypothetical protein
MLTDKRLADWADLAKRDDWHQLFVGSDLRQLIIEVQRLRAARTTEDAVERVALKSWAEMRDDNEEIIACGERWKAVAAKIGCQLRGFNDDHGASFFTPDGNVIEVGPKFRAVIAALEGGPRP